MNGELKVILSSKKALLINDNHTRIKSNYDYFYAPNGAYDTAQIVYLLGIYILKT